MIGSIFEKKPETIPPIKNSLPEKTPFIEQPHKDDTLQKSWESKKKDLQRGFEEVISSLQGIENNTKRQTMAQDEVKKIRAAYYSLSLKFHPDRICDETQKLIATTIFNEVKEWTDKAIQEIEATQYNVTPLFNIPVAFHI